MLDTRVKLKKVFRNTYAIVQQLCDWQTVSLLFLLAFFRVGPVATDSLEPMFPVGTIVVTYQTWPLHLYSRLFVSKISVRAWLANYYVKNQVVGCYNSSYFNDRGKNERIFHKVSALTDNNKIIISGYYGYNIILNTLAKTNLKIPAHTNSDPLLYTVVYSLRNNRKVDIISPEEISSCYLFTLCTNFWIGRLAIVILLYKPQIMGLMFLLMFLSILFDLTNNDIDSMR